MISWNKVICYLQKFIPKQDEIKDSVLYRFIGEKLFRPELWKLSRRSAAGGLALGVFIALTPTVGTQMIISGLAAYFLGVNIPIAVACAWITNPVTIPIIFPLQFKLGLILGGHAQKGELIQHSGPIRMFIKYAKPLWIGSLVSAGFFSILSYATVIIAWDFIEDKIKKHSEVKQDTETTKIL